MSESETSQDKIWAKFLKDLDKKFGDHATAIKKLASDQAKLSKTIKNAIMPETKGTGKKGTLKSPIKLDANKIVSQAIKDIADAILNSGGDKKDVFSDKAKKFYEDNMKIQLDLSKVRLTREQLRNKAIARDLELGEDD